MIIRKADKEDEAPILSVVKRSMSEGINFNNAIWMHKHNYNPFGASVIYIAEIDQKIVGVRAFMQWQWKVGINTYNALRAVDTVTLPEYRGKGIFSKLTLEVIRIEGLNFDFIFNTPNNLSKPGYLKMGWNVINSIKFNLLPVINFKIFKRQREIINECVRIEDLDLILQRHNKLLENSGQIYTPKSVDFLKWRYKNNPIQKYDTLCHKYFFIAYYKKKHKYFNELRISELILNITKKETIKEIKKILKQLAKENKCIIVTFANVPFLNIGCKLNLGPQLTLKHLSNNDNFFMNIDNWSYSLGDLELY